MEQEIIEIIDLALKEDIHDGDITTLAAIPKLKQANAILFCKDEGILSGIKITEYIFHKVDPGLKVSFSFKDGDKLKYGESIGTISGSAQSILTAERTALNFLQRMCGIATTANKYQSLVAHTKAKIIDTRKTAPGLRLLDKQAVKDGGCANHRIGLWDMYLIKDNHIASSGSISGAVKACREYNSIHNTHFKIEVETENLEQVKEALSISADIIMLDNFELNKMKEAVNFINNRCLIEASGGVNLNTVKAIAETGVDFISVGALTHSVKAFDISLDIDLNQ